MPKDNSNLLKSLDRYLRLKEACKFVLQIKTDSTKSEIR